MAKKGKTKKKLKGLEAEIESLAGRVAALEGRETPAKAPRRSPAAADPVAAAAERVRASAGTKPAGAKPAGARPKPRPKPAAARPRPKPTVPAPAASDGRS